jgi:ABC-type transport system involved in cytochrome c biogenesis permease component
MSFSIGFPEILLFYAISVGAMLVHLPWIMALGQRKRNALGIFLVTFLLGWTVIGWVGALAWALLSKRKDA